MPLCSEVWPFVLPQWWDTLLRFNWLGCLELRDHSAVCLPASRPGEMKQEVTCGRFLCGRGSLSLLALPSSWDPAQDDDKVQKPGQRKKHKNLRTVGAPVFLFHSTGIGRPVTSCKDRRGPGTEVSSNSSQPVPLSVYPSQRGGREAAPFAALPCRGHWSTLSSKPVNIQAHDHPPLLDGTIQAPWLPAS